MREINEVQTKLVNGGLAPLAIFVLKDIALVYSVYQSAKWAHERKMR
ncbi:hypothetical protein [Pseudoalteromonas sp. NC201]|nr:hypothetical protein [Pseudoalteromonas sp. NC201]AUJ71767.1 hypothetical protein PNC201_17750 [Pseudoalteromonas sp. NC201]